MRGVILLVGIVLGLSTPAHGQAAFPTENQSRELVDRLVLDRAAILAALERRNEEREGGILIALTQRDHELRSAMRMRADLQSEIAILARELSDVTEQRRSASRDLALRDVAFRADIETYRAHVTSLAGSPDPRRRAALQRYADGDRSGALAILVQIQEAESRAVASGWREIAALESDMLDRGERTFAEVARAYELADRLDPSNFAGVTALATLYSAMGRVDARSRLVDRIVSLARTDTERADAQRLLHEVMLDANRHAEALAAVQQEVELRRRIVRRDPSVGAQRAYAAALMRLAHYFTAYQTAGPIGAIAGYAALPIYRQLHNANPTSLQARYDLTLALIGMAGMIPDPDAVSREAVQLARQSVAQRPQSTAAAEALALALATQANYPEAEVILRRLVAQDPSLGAQRLNLGEMLWRHARMEDFRQAQRLYVEAIEILVEYANSNPTDIDRQYRAARIQIDYGRLLREQGNTAAARRQFTAALEFGRRVNAATDEGDFWYRSAYDDAQEELRDLRR